MVYNCLPLGNVSLEPQEQCLAFQSPPDAKRFPSLEKYSLKSFVVVMCFGGQYTADKVVSELLS